MKTIAYDRKSASSRAGVKGRPFLRVVVARRAQPERATRVWSLLLPQSFDIGDEASTRRAPGRTQLRSSNTGVGEEIEQWE
jgi:hypothetical protein